MRLTAIVLCYAGFLRYSDLMTVQWQEILFFPSHMELFLEKTKTDQYREGRWVLISRVPGRYCPVALVERLLRLGQYAAQGAGPLIRNTSVTPSQQLIRERQPSYTTVLSWFKAGAERLGLDPDEYGTHSGRRGGATRAANVDVPDRLFKEHGAWRSERVKDGYVVSSLQARLSVTANLGFQQEVSIQELEQFEQAARLSAVR
jgi:integrase